MLQLTLAFVGAVAGPDYGREVFPILNKYCVGCHTADEAKGSLVMESFAEFTKGGKNGPAFVAGKSAESRLVRMVEGTLKPRMPPKGHPRPTDAEVAVIKKWIDAGAPGPAASPAVVKLNYPRIKPKANLRASVNAVAWSPTASLVAIAGYEVVTLADPATGYIVRELKGHTARVNAVRFSSDGKLLVAAAGEAGMFGEARLWEVSTGTLIRAIRGHRDALYAIDLSRDGRVLATAGYDKDVRLWDANTGNERAVLSGHNDAVYDLAISPDGRFVASASGDRTVKIWDIAKGVRLDTLNQPLQDQYTVAFSPDGNRVAGAGVDNRIRVWRLGPQAAEGANKLLLSRFAHESPILKLVFSADGRTLISSAQDRTVKIWTGDAVGELALFERQPDWAAALALSPDGKNLLVGRHNGTLAIYDVAKHDKQRDLVPSAPPPPKPEVVVVSPPGIQRGVATSLRLVGQHLATEKTTLKFNHPKVRATIASARTMPRGQDELVVQLQSDADLPIGPLTFTVTTAGGASVEQTVHVDELPQATEQEPNDAVGQAQLVALPISVWGLIGRPGDSDHVAFDAKEGQSIVFDVAARRLGGKLNAMLSIHNAAGQLMATASADERRAEALLAYAIPATGRYVVRITDLMAAGGPKEHAYRISIGELPVVTGVFPLGVPANTETELALVGHNLDGPPEKTVNRDPKRSAPAGFNSSKTVKVKAGAGAELLVPLDSHRYRFRDQPKVVVGMLPEIRESEPNDQPDRAVPVTAPGTANGRIDHPGDADLYRFHAQRGAPWIIETAADRLGAPTDTRIEVLDAAGRPVPRVLLEATRDSHIEFRGIDSQQTDIRVKNWEEMELNQYLYLRGEVGKLFRMPEGPDSGFVFYNRGGVRLTDFDTDATTHALNDPCYIVEPHRPGTTLVPNGLPTFLIHFANDDAGDRKSGHDSRLTFTAPADGDYLVRVTDSCSHGGDRFAYRLTVRRPAPDFSVSIGGTNPTVNAGSGKQLSFTADRADGFVGEIRIAVVGLPPGYRVSSPIAIQAGHLEASAVLYADAHAAAPAAAKSGASKVTATAIINGATVTKPVGSLGKIQLAPKPKLIVRLDPPEITITPGGAVVANLVVERNGFADRISFRVPNLPHGVIVDNIGLNGILLPPGQTRRQLFLAARPWVPATSRPFFAVAVAEGDQVSPPIVLHVKPPTPLAGNTAR